MPNRAIIRDIVTGKFKEPVLRYSVRHQDFVLLQELHYKGYTVPVGTRTDGVSSPLALRGLFPQCDEAFVPSIFHDFHYGVGKLSRKLSDEIFYSMMLDFGVSEFRAKAMYVGLRVGGWVHYNDDYVDPKDDNGIRG